MNLLTSKFLYIDYVHHQSMTMMMIFMMMIDDDNYFYEVVYITIHYTILSLIYNLYFKVVTSSYQIMSLV